MFSSLLSSFIILLLFLLLVFIFIIIFSQISLFQLKITNQGFNRNLNYFYKSLRWL